MTARSSGGSGMARALWLGVILISCMGIAAPPARGQQICATVPELGSLAREIGGDQVSITVFAKGTEDAHFVEPKPSFIRSLSQADLLIHVGLFLESGWLTSLLQNCRNERVLRGGSGFVDASVAIQPLEVPTGRIDRSMGDVHPGGNPHYLLDPLNGLKVARLIRDKLSELRPQQRAQYDERYRLLADKVSRLLIGESLASRYKLEDVPKLALLYEHGKLGEFLKSQEQDGLLGGWLGMMQPHYGTKAVDDHNMWPYFARRFGIRIVAHLEPKPGIPPTTSHIASVVEEMRSQRITLVLANAYYDPRHAQFVSSQTGGKVIHMAHQVGARPGTDSYLSMVDYNVRQLAAALGGSR